MRSRCRRTVYEQVVRRQPTGLGEAASHLGSKPRKKYQPDPADCPAPLDPRPLLWVDAQDVSPAWNAPTSPPPTSSQQASKELAMHIGEDQQEFEILPTEQEQQPVVLPEHEPQRQPEDTPA